MAAPACIPEIKRVAAVVDALKELSETLLREAKNAGLGIDSEYLSSSRFSLSSDFELNF